MRFATIVLLGVCGCAAPVAVVPDASVPAIEDAGRAFDAGVRPAGPVPGELTLWQLDLPAGLIPKSGESAILVGPDGTLVVIDVGNSNHDDELRAAIRELNTTWLAAARGYRARAPLEVVFPPSLISSHSS